MKTLLVVLAMASSAQAGVQITRLRCEYLANPLGIDVVQPRLSWILEASDPDERGQRQTAYQVLVASSEDKLGAGQPCGPWAC